MTGHSTGQGMQSPAMRRVRDLLRGPAIVCDGRATIREAAKLMTDAGRRAVVIPTETTGFGIFTEGDLRARVVVGGIDSNQPVSTVMTPSAVTVDPDRLGADAVTDMLEYGLRHLPVVTEAGALMGVLELSDLLTSATNQGFELRAALATAQDDAHLVETARAVPVLVTELVASRVSPLDIGATLAVLIDVTVRRAIELVVGGDERPDFAWLSLGSVARREALPSSDIDSALVWGGESHHEGADAAKSIHDILDLCGFPRDTKNAVATQARFARTLPQWRTALRKWVSNPYQDQALVMLSMLADARVVAGDPALDPRPAALDQLRLHPAVMRLLLREAVGDKAKLHSFKDVMTRRTGTVDLKASAVQPIVNIARWAGISVGARTSSTLERLKAAAGSGFLLDDDAQVLIESFEVLQQIRVRHQTDQFAAGRPPTDEVVISELTPLSRSLLSNAVREVAGVQRRLEYCRVRVGATRHRPVNRTALEQVLAAERLEGWDPSNEQIAELEAVMIGMLSRREYFEQELARAVGLSSAIPPRIRWRRSAPYVYRGTSVLENNFDVRDPAALQSLEFAATALRLGEAHLGSDLVPHTRDTAELLLLHQHVFQDLYQWAGHIRTVDIRKGAATFAPVSAIRNYLSEVEEIIAAVDWVALDHGAASFALASVYSTLNHAHPFREGNGRTGTLFLHRLAADTRYQLDLSRVSRTEWVSASRDSAPFRPTGTPSPRPFIDLFNRALTR